MVNTLVQFGSYVGSRRSEGRARSGQRFSSPYLLMAASLSGRFERDSKAMVIGLPSRFHAIRYPQVVDIIVYVTMTSHRCANKVLRIK